MKKLTKKNIVLTIAVILVAALVVGIFVMLFGDRAPDIPSNPSDVTDVPDVPDDEWQDVPDPSGEFTVMYGTEMTFTPERSYPILMTVRVIPDHISTMWTINLRCFRMTTILRNLSRSFRQRISFT